MAQSLASSSSWELEMNLDSFFSINPPLSQSLHPIFLPTYFLIVSSLCYLNHYYPNPISHHPLPTLLQQSSKWHSSFHSCLSSIIHNLTHCAPLYNPSFFFSLCDLLLNPYNCLASSPGRLKTLCQFSDDTFQYVAPTLIYGFLFCFVLFLFLFFCLPISAISLWAHWGHCVLFIFVDPAFSMSLGT
jgi:hypothetical protein